MKTQTNKPLILRLLDISSTSYELQLFEAAYKYMELKRPGDEQGHALLVASPSFWQWWTRQWERRNAILLYRFNYDDELMVPGEAVRQRARKEYDIMHNVSQLNIMMNRRIVKSTFEMECLKAGVNSPASKEAVV